MSRYGRTSTGEAALAAIIAIVLALLLYAAGLCFVIGVIVLALNLFGVL